MLGIPENSLAIIGSFRNYGWSYLSEFLEVAGPFAAALLAASFGPWVGVAGGMGVDIAKVAALRRASDRYNKTLELLPFQVSEFKDRFAEFAADIQVEIHELSKLCLNEPYNRKYRYFVEFLLGRMSVKNALKKDKYYRFRRWVEQLDLVALKCLSKFKADQSTQFPPLSEKQVARYYKRFDDSLQEPILTNLTYLRRLVDKEPTTYWELIPQLSANGILYLDRGGGAAAPGDQATLVWHHDVANFAQSLRNADERSAWKMEKLDNKD